MKKIYLSLVIALSIVLPARWGLAATGCTYPTTLDTFADVTSGQQLTSALYNKLQCAAEKIEAELGTLPKGTYASVTARLNDAVYRGLATITAGGVIFGHSTLANNVAHDPANIFWDDANDRLGIKTNAPGQPLDVNGNARLRADLLFFGSTVDDVRLFHGGAGSDGALTLYSLLNNTRTALDIGPTRGTLPTTDALGEMVLYRTQDQGTNFERLNFSAMANPAGGGYRIGQEFGGTGTRRDITFAQENGVTGGTEIYLRIADRDSDSQRIQIENGHLRFETAARGGATGAYWIGRGGGATINYNVPSAATHVFTENGNELARFATTGFTPGFAINKGAAPTAVVDVKNTSDSQSIMRLIGDGANANINVARYSADVSGAVFIGRKSRGTEASPAQSLAADFPVIFESRGSNASGGVENALATFRSRLDENTTTTGHGSSWEFFSVGIGSTSQVRVIDTLLSAPTFGTTSGVTALITNKNTPTNSDGYWWVDCSGTSPARICAIKINDSATVRTIASVTF